jgi:hypothetical protein
VRDEFLEEQSLALQVEHPEPWLRRRERVIDDREVAETVEKALRTRALRGPRREAQHVGVRSWRRGPELRKQARIDAGRDRGQARQCASAQQDERREAAAEAPSHSWSVSSRWAGFRCEAAVRVTGRRAASSVLRSVRVGPGPQASWLAKLA